MTFQEYLQEDFFIQYYDDKGKELLGSDGAQIIYDLKTVKGVYKRLKGFQKILNPRASTYKIFTYSHDDRYNEKKWKEVESGKVEDIKTSQNKLA